MMSDICNSILGQAKNGIELHNCSVLLARHGWFFNEGCFHSVFVFAKYQTSQYPRIYNYFASCYQTPNFPYPLNYFFESRLDMLGLLTTFHTALSDFERRLPLVDFQSHKHYSEGFPSFLEWKFVNRRIDYSHKAVRARERSSIPHHATAFYSWVVWENQRHPLTAHQIVLRLTIFSDRSPPANENEKLVGMWSRAALILELRHACAATLKSATSAFSNFPRIFLFSITGAVSSWFSDSGFQSKLRSSVVLQSEGTQFHHAHRQDYHHPVWRSQYLLQPVANLRFPRP